MRANPAARLVGESSKPTAPAISQKPVKHTKARGQGKEGGIMRTRSSRIRVKCAVAVKKSMVDSAQRAAVCQEFSHSTPNAPAARYTTSDAVATIRPIIGMFFATSRFSALTPHEFFGVGFWIGFVLHLIAAEAWIHAKQQQAAGFQE
jgi:hypothetical protein